MENNSKKRSIPKIVQNAEKQKLQEKPPAQSAVENESRDTTGQDSFLETKATIAALKLDYHWQEFQEALSAKIKYETLLELSKHQKGVNFDPNPSATYETSPPPENDLISKQEAANLLGVHPRTIDNYVRRGLLKPKFLPTGQKRFYRADVLRLLERHKEEKRKNKQKGEDES